MEKHTVIDNIFEQRYEMEFCGGMATAEYTKAPGQVVITSTYVPPQHEGKGLGAQLVRGVLEDIRSKGLQVVPQCSFVAQYILRHPEWEELIYKHDTAE